MATLKDTIVLGNLSTTGTLNSTTIYEGGTSLVDKYAAKSHTHGYLPLSGGVLTGNLCFKEISNGTFPVTSSGIVWNGSTDNAAIFYRLDAADAGRLVFRTGDDTNCNFVWNNTASGDIMQLTGAGELTVKGTKVALEGKIISRATSLPTASESSKDFVEVNQVLYKKVKTGSSSYEYRNTDDSYPEIIDLT